MKTLKLFAVLCTLGFTFCISSTAQIKSKNVRVVDTVYTPAGYAGGPLNAILWLPSVTNGAAIILAHHAGATPEDYSIYGNFFSSYGYVVISIDYYSFFHVLGPPLYPDPVRAFKTAIEFLRKNAMTFGCYTGKIAGFGFSEGAMHWAETISWDNDDAYFNTDPSINDHLDAVICYYGLYDNYNHLESPFFTTPGNEALISDYFSPNPTLRATKGNPLANIANITTPVLLFHGTSDQVWNYEQSVEFNDSLIAHGKSSVLKLLPGRDHIFDCRGTINPLHLHYNQFSTDGEIARDTALAFISRTLQINNIHCPYNKSYWKNHATDWNADAIPMKLGTTNSYIQSQLLTILNTSAGSDPSLKLAQELISAKLNLANGAVASPIVSTILAADNLIGNRIIPIVPGISSNSLQGKQMTDLGNTLNSYNNGTMTPNCSNSGFSMTQNNSSDIFSLHNSSDNFSLRIFPNPGTQLFVIRYSLSKKEKVLVKIYDVNGKLIKALANAEMQAGAHQLVWNVRDEKGSVASGIYYLRFNAGNYIETKNFLS